ncbi:MarR family winged helix-turn-helix transcriptional regulator [Amycolatopsis sp. GM8]|uniref:MarR family winged helix-turn-helix transcriptional regulator n=1 Tax=Amycolatopsis sp. GM8 TaxID=2896530 RepID=UPI001F0190CD|nr:MarR family transcriptional regulator [Amycolatopsis sp. GM8]
MRSQVDELAARLYGGMGLTARRLRQLHAPGDLTLPERAVLARLDRGGPATAAELARAEQITPQAMGTTLGGLEERGFVERRADPHDGRRIILSLTRSGREVLRHKRDARVRQFAKALSEHFTPAELEALRTVAPLIERLAEHL